MRKTDDVLGTAKPPTRMSDSQLSEVKQIAKKTTVRLVSKDRLGFDGKALRPLERRQSSHRLNLATFMDEILRDEVSNGVRT